MSKYTCDKCNGVVSTPRKADPAKVRKVHNDTCPGRNRK